ncbi:hypothetical protein [Dyadobacter flavalbus]|nr:hypothetical protein [Dyadobacter flavalbus]
MSREPSNMRIDPFYVTELEDALINFWIPKMLEFPLLMNGTSTGK